MVYAPQPRAQFHDGDGVIAGGRVSYYQSGTSTLKAIYADDGVTELPNPQILDQDGYVQDGGVFYGEGSYKVVVERPVSPIAPGEIPGFLEVNDVDYAGTYTRGADDFLGNPTWQNDSDATLRIKIDSTFYALYSTAAPSVYLSTRLTSLGVFGVWSRPGMTVGYPAYEVYWTMNNISGSPVADPTESAIFIAGVSELRNLAPGAANLVYITGYYNPADGGEGWVKWDADSIEADNSGTVFAPAGNPATGRWLRLIEGEYITPNLFGCIPGSSLSVGSSMQLMANWCQAQGLYRMIRIPAGLYRLNANVSFNGPSVDLHIDDGAKFISPSIDCTLTITCRRATCDSRSPIVDPDQVTLAFDPLDTSCWYRPEWAGPMGSGTGSSSVDDWDTFKRVAANAVGREVRLDGQYYLEGPDGGDTLVVERLVFGPGAFLSNKWSNRVLTIKTYKEGESRRGQIFKETAGGNGGSSFRITEMTEVPARHWLGESGSITTATMENMVTCVTNNATLRKTVVFDQKGVLTFTQDVTVAACPGLDLLHWSFRAGSSIKWSAILYIFSMDGQLGCLNRDSTGYLSCGQDIEPTWFGAVQHDSTAASAAISRDALNAALRAAVYSYPTALAGGLADYYVDGQLAVGDQAGGVKTNLSIRGLRIRSTVDLASTYLLKTTLTGELMISDLVVQDSGNASNSFDMGGHVGCIVKNSTFQGAVIASTSGASEFTGCTFAAGYTNGNESSCYLRNNYIVAADFTIGASGGVVIGNECINADLVLKDPQNLTVTGNNFNGSSRRSRIRFEGQSAGWTATGVHCTGNTLMSDLTAYVGICGKKNMAASGHKAYVDLNRFHGTVVGSGTRVYGTASYTWNNASHTPGSAAVADNTPGYFAEMYLTTGDPFDPTPDENWRIILNYPAWYDAAAERLWGYEEVGTGPYTYPGRTDQPVLCVGRTDLDPGNAVDITSSVDLAYPAMAGGRNYVPADL